MSDFPSILKSIRESRRMSQSELAKLARVSKSAISMYERGQREPNFEMLETFADIFNVPLASLMSTDVDADSDRILVKLCRLSESSRIELEKYIDYLLERENR